VELKDVWFSKSFLDGALTRLWPKLKCSIWSEGFMAGALTRLWPKLKPSTFGLRVSFAPLCVYVKCV